LRHQRAQHLARIAGQTGVVKFGGQIGDGPPGVARDQLDDLGSLGSEAAHAQFVVQEQGRNVGAVEQ